MRGCWIAYHSDWSGFALFGKEVDALRYAVSNNMNVGRVGWGETLGGGQYPEPIAQVADAPLIGSDDE
jgi:hypothetical protein